MSHPEIDMVENFLAYHATLQAAGLSPLLLLFFELFPQIAMTVDCFARSEIFQLEKLTNFDLGFALQARLKGDALGPFDGLFARLDLDNPISRDELFRLGKGPVGNGALAAGKLNADAL